MAVPGRGHRDRAGAQSELSTAHPPRAHLHPYLASIPASPPSPPRPLAALSLFANMLLSFPVSSSKPGPLAAVTLWRGDCKTLPPRLRPPRSPQAPKPRGRGHPEQTGHSRDVAPAAPRCDCPVATGLGWGPRAGERGLGNVTRDHGPGNEQLRGQEANPAVAASAV